MPQTGPPRSVRRHPPPPAAPPSVFATGRRRLAPDGRAAAVHPSGFGDRNRAAGRVVVGGVPAPYGDSLGGFPRRAGQSLALEALIGFGVVVALDRFDV